jgi:hypothetical protein
MSELLNTNISSTLVRENVQGGAVDLVFRRTDLLNWFMSRATVSRLTGAFPLQWNVVSAANTSAEVFAEGQAAPIPGKQTYNRASISPFYIAVSAGFSGRVRDQVANGGVYTDPLQDAIVKGTADSYKKLDDTLCGTTQDQSLQSAIDSGDTYAGLAPGSVTTHAAKETAVGGAMTLGTLIDMQEALALTPYTAATTDILSCANQISNYLELVGPQNGTAANRLVRFNDPMQGGRLFDAGMLPNGYGLGGMAPAAAFNTVPWFSIGGLTNTVVLFADTSPTEAGPGIELKVVRDLTVERLAKTGDDETILITSAYIIVVRRRNAQGKLTGLAA